MVSLSMVQASTAPSVARMPQEMSPPSKAGPAEQAHADPIRMEPFVPSFFRTDHLYVRDIQLKMNPLAELIVAPNIGSYVGGDITAGALVSMIWNRPEMSLFIDLGTNGELVG